MRGAARAFTSSIAIHEGVSSGCTRHHLPMWITAVIVRPRIRWGFEIPSDEPGEAYGVRLRQEGSLVYLFASKDVTLVADDDLQSVREGQRLRHHGAQRHRRPLAGAARR